MIHAREDYNRIQDPAGLIPEDEPVFLLRAKDATAPQTVEFWAEELLASNGSAQMAEMAYEHSKTMLAWQKANPDLVKLPDLPAELVNQNGMKAIQAERIRQIKEEGYTPVHDDDYHLCQLYRAGMVYFTASGDTFPSGWPWGPQYWKPSTRRRNLEKAGALLMAETARINRIIHVIAEELNKLPE